VAEERVKAITVRGRKHATPASRANVRAEDCVDGGEGAVDLFGRVVEVGRDADAGAGTPIDEDVALEEFGADLLRMRRIDGDGASTAFGIETMRAVRRFDFSRTSGISSSRRIFRPGAAA
jgi:hypothetical protein